jgi:hypothetical protein
MVFGQAVEANVFNPSTREAEAGRSLVVRGQPDLQRVTGQPGLLYGETLCEGRKEGRKEGRNLLTIFTHCTILDKSLQVNTPIFLNDRSQVVS